MARLRHSGRRVSGLAIACLALSLLGGCREAELIAAQTTWQLDAINEKTVPDTDRATLRIPALGRLEGQAPCNRYSGTWVGVEDDFRTEGIASTRMACPAIDAEQVYLAALRRVTSATVTDDTLTLTGPGLTLRFSPLLRAG
ncbi:META domain-containing protein [Pseudooceanicola sediminis]|nr:META domain-containing protein [Pseudooceanicola sediminis]